MTKKLILLLIVISFICCSKPQQLEYRVSKTLVNDITTGLEKEELDTYRWIAAFNVDDEGSVYIVDNMSNNNKLIKVDRNGQYQWCINTNGQGPGEFLRITDVCCWQDKVFVCDQNKMKIIIFSKNGNFIEEFKMKSASYPLDIDINSSGILFIQLGSPINDLLLHKYTWQGEYLGSIIKKKFKDKDDWLDNRINRLEFCIDSDNNILTAFAYFYIICKYDANGRLLNTWERKLPYKPEKPWVFRNQNSIELKGDVVINDIAVDSKNRIFVMWGFRGNEQGMQIDLFSPQGKLMSEFHTGIKPYYDLQSFTIGSDDCFYVANQHLEEPNIYKFILEITKR